MKMICVFCGSKTGKNPAFTEAAKEFGKLLVANGIGLVYGGGDVGLMGVIADEMLAAGGSVIGVIPHGLVVREVAHKGLTEQIIVSSMHERKAKMAELADAFVALPGGMGTFDELCEILTWGQLGIHSKPCGILNVSGYFAPMLAMFNHAVAEGFLKTEDRDRLLESSDARELLGMLARYQAPAIEKWLDSGNI